jgi:hypothetical protein
MNGLTQKEILLMANTARLKKILITPELMTGWFTVGGGTGAADCVEGLPEGALFVGAYLDDSGDVPFIALIYFHDAWEPTDITLNVLPEIRVTFRERGRLIDSAGIKKLGKDLREENEHVTVFEDFINGLEKKG